MSRETDNLVRAIFGFKEGNPGYPCYYCGVVTTLRNAEDFEVCEKHQKEAMELDWKGMDAKYPLKGKDERNPGFFAAEAEANRNRVKRLTRQQLDSMIGVNGSALDEAIQRFHEGNATEWDINWIGDCARTYIGE